MYVDEYVENDVLAQDGMELVRLLYLKALEKIGQAKEHLAAGKIRERSLAIAHVMEIVMELQSSLDFDRGGQIAKDLERLYVYIQERLNEANTQQQLKPLEEAERLLFTLFEGWQACRTAEEEPELVASEGGSGRAWTL